MHEVFCVEDLVLASRRGDRPKYLLFWGHTPPADGSVSKACFSQWFPSPLTVEGIHYRTAEHFMMAAKARLFGDLENEERVLTASHPKQAKELGRKVRGFDEETWVRERYRLVVKGNLAKFTHNPRLKDFLLGTGRRVLVEASPYDKIWGIGLAADHPDAEKPAAWKGLNLLGFALMEVRAALQSQKSSP
ncbi:NADAR family protein [Luteolibacter arcticus]|uniref:NADAR family protein n=1 Tax=Luteolibacter arcticus TaxID=1581411 RepID=A0ABT3GCT1_9BACT|nr:NADAR family protein [Luteolibacter arcticus]MCW1921110.1 NADAR family protein [Luteolibacter arcticus]